MQLLSSCVGIYLYIVCLQGAGWFGENGLLRVQPNPLSQLRARPSVFQYPTQRSVSFKRVRCSTYIILLYSQFLRAQISLKWFVRIMVTLYS